MMQFNTAAFTAPLPGEFGTSPRTGAIRLPGLFNDDLSATKGFKFGESRNLQFRADFFNAFRHFNVPTASSIDVGLNDVTMAGSATASTSNMPPVSFS